MSINDYEKTTNSTSNKMSKIRPVKVNIVISSITAKSGGSIRGSFSTPMLDIEERNAMMDLHDITCETFFVPLNGDKDVEVIKIDADLHTKTQSQRVRSCLYVLWEQQNKPCAFPDFYKEKTEQIIEWLKTKMKEK